MALKSDKTRFNLSITKELDWLLKGMAEEDGRSQNSIILFFVYEGLRTSEYARELFQFLEDEYVDYNSYKDDKRLNSLFGGGTRKRTSTVINTKRAIGVDKFGKDVTIVELSKFLRGVVNSMGWREMCKEKVGNKCEITGVVESLDDNVRLEVHHLKCFHDLIIDGLKFYDIEPKTHLNEFSKEELEMMVDYIKFKHKDNTNAIVIDERLHTLFHSNRCYGYKNNTPEQFEEFKQRYLNGEFDDVLGSN